MSFFHIHWSVLDFLIKEKNMNKKHLALYIMALTITLTIMGGCGISKKAQNLTQQRTSVTSDPSVDAESEEAGSDTVFKFNSPSDETGAAQEKELPSDAEQIEEDKETFSFAELSDLYFYNSSGAGAWGTELYINEDGSFYGNYRDFDMGDTGNKYPNGVCYYSGFAGKFSAPKKENAYTYSVTIVTIKLDKTEDTEEIKDGIRYIYTKPYGLEDAKKILIFLPGAPIKELPRNFSNWVFQDGQPADKNLTFYGLYNEVEGSGFKSFEQVKISAIDDELKEVQRQADSIEQKLENEAVTQLDMNQLSYQLFNTWDAKLNDIWEKIKLKLNPDEIKQLKEEELQWIAYKEDEIRKAGADNVGGSIQLLLENVRAAQLTRERVYELAKYLR